MTKGALLDCHLSTASSAFASLSARFVAKDIWNYILLVFTRIVLPLFVEVECHWVNSRLMYFAFLI